MNSPIVIASAILAVAIVAAAWLIKPLPTTKTTEPCWESKTEGNTPVMINKCTGDLWAITERGGGFVHVFSAKNN